MDFEKWQEEANKKRIEELDSRYSPSNIKDHLDRVKDNEDALSYSIFAIAMMMYNDMINEKWGVGQWIT